MSYQTDMAAGFADAQAVLGGVTATCLTVTFPIIPGDLQMMLLLLPAGGGFLDKINFGFQCLQTDAPAALRSGILLTVADAMYRVEHIAPGLGNPLLNVFCSQVTK